MKVKRRFYSKETENFINLGDIYTCTRCGNTKLINQEDLDRMIKDGAIVELEPEITELSKKEVLEYMKVILGMNIPESILGLLDIVGKGISELISNQMFLKTASILLDLNHYNEIEDLREVFYVHLSGEIRKLPTSRYPFHMLRKIAWFRTVDEARMALSILSQPIKRW